ncbi:hypothetical protein L218DRAFT_997054 [Marasmius fiardii PR-910]|nr:hypothetical protein L218DRAFT_997054 [Marasmius fiardii PR-910]
MSDIGENNHGSANNTPEPEERTSWMHLSNAAKAQIKADKMSKVKKPSELNDLHPEDYKQWEEEMDFVYQEGGVTEPDAKIYLAMRQMLYKLRKAIEKYKSSKGLSYEDFLKDLKKELGVKESS